LKEVWILAIVDAGEMAVRNFERNRRRYLRGKGFGIEGHENGIFAFVNAVGEADAGNFDLGMVVVGLGLPLERLAGWMAFQGERGGTADGRGGGGRGWILELLLEDATGCT
jgi:hypothetical protein